ncbi:hypothetical protein BCR34DRAFT_638837 [Clohesyomyces aquaticus]|uniref:Uncharacterized protein n=1 Tax=Clohesyomyces aquaticus TaxID=1231657 RepID=A0A1Y2A2T8_9PLEO|nr:hypothetical protein BCR34DRAFT_638837 [Clohesyomyces aquaticus]
MSLRSFQKPSPFNMPVNVFWVCGKCGWQNLFEETSEVRPLGMMVCAKCKVVANRTAMIGDIALTSLGYGPSKARGKKTTGTEGGREHVSHYSISLPPWQSGPPLTVFAWSCCQCGRSHLRESREQKQSDSASTTIWDPEKPKAEVSLGKKLMGAYKRFIAQENVEPVPQLRRRKLHSVLAMVVAVTPDFLPQTFRSLSRSENTYSTLPSPALSLICKIQPLHSHALEAGDVANCSIIGGLNLLHRHPPGPVLVSWFKLGAAPYGQIWAQCG